MTDEHAQREPSRAELVELVRRHEAQVAGRRVERAEQAAAIEWRDAPDGTVSGRPGA